MNNLQATKILIKLAKNLVAEENVTLTGFQKRKLQSVSAMTINKLKEALYEIDDLNNLLEKFGKPAILREDQKKITEMVYRISKIRNEW